MLKKHLMICLVVLSKKKGVNVKGILLEKMVPQDGVELIVGIQNDPQFGPMIMVGLGGIMTEVFKDVAFRMLTYYYF